MTVGNRKNVLLFAEDPGGANFIRYLPEAIKTYGMEPVLFASGTAIIFLRERGYKCHSLPDGQEEKLLKKLSPVFVIVGTAANPEAVSHSLVDISKALAIPTIGVVDAVMSAPIRFKGKTNNPLAHVPDWLFVPDKTTADGYVSLGYNKNNISVTGHPHHHYVSTWAKELSHKDHKTIRSRLFSSDIENKKVIIFAAEPPIPLENISPQHGTIKGWGDTTERTHVALQALIDIVQKDRNKYFIVLRLHARNERKLFDQYMNDVDLISVGGEALELVAASDVVVGLTSSLIIEAAVMGWPTISVVMNENDAKELPMQVMEKVYQVSTMEAFHKALRNCFVKGQENQDATASWTSSSVPRFIDGFNCILSSKIQNTIIE